MADKDVDGLVFLLPSPFPLGKFGYSEAASTVFGQIEEFIVVVSVYHLFTSNATNVQMKGEAVGDYSVLVKYRLGLCHDSCVHCLNLIACSDH